MGKTARWFKGLFGMKKDKENYDIINHSNNSDKNNNKVKKRWSFARSSLNKNPDINNVSVTDHHQTEKFEQKKHAIAVAVVRVTGHGRSAAAAAAALYHVENDKFAAVKIQAAFRGYLSRKALRALKGVVKLQAIVRGYLVRKRATATLHSMQALFRAQASVRSQMARRSIINNHHHIYSSNSQIGRSREKNDECSRSEYHSKRLSGSLYDDSFGGFDESSKIVEFHDITYKPKSRSRRIHTFMSDSGDDDHRYLPTSSLFPCLIPSRQSNLRDGFDWDNTTNDDYKFATAQNTPRFLNSRPAFTAQPPVTPSRSVCGDNDFRPYSIYPSYMSNTQSFKAKLRSHSAPKQRPETMQRKRLSLSEMMAASRTSFIGVRMQGPSSQVEED